MAKTFRHLIPKQFQIADRTWRIQWDDLGKREDGCTDFRRGIITLSSRIEHDRAILLRTFWHELLHATAGTMGWSRVNGDEDRIDGLAALVSQAVSSFRF